MSQRRSFGGPRREASERVTIRGPGASFAPTTADGSSGDGSSDADEPNPGAEVHAWTLNVSRGGIRVILDDPVTVGADYQVIVGDAAARPARVVWVRDEADGQIAGMQFLDVEGGVVPTSEYPGPPSRAPV